MRFLEEESEALLREKFSRLVHGRISGAHTPLMLFALADKQMSASLACMHDDPGYPWTLRKLAERVGMSRSIFALRFQETVGATPMEYLTRWRMLLAGHRLTHSDDPISVIALSLGYESESAFGKAFRRVMVRSPGQYRRWPESGFGERKPRSREMNQ